MATQQFLVRDTDPLGKGLEVLNTNGLGLALTVDDDGHFIGMLSEVDVRRCLSSGGSLVSLVRTALPTNAGRASIPERSNGQGEGPPLVAAERRLADFTPRIWPRRIPVAEPFLGGNERRYVNECLDTNWISSQGPFVRRFEERFAERLGVTDAIAVSNGTVALHLALVALGIGPGDEVIVPDLTFAATINAVIYCGATPVLVDVDRESWNIDPNSVIQAITERTRAIMPVHLYGKPAAMDELMVIARHFNLKVIEDAAESIGASLSGRPTGTIGDAGAFSFFSNKLITTGEGGMLVFRDAAAAERARRLRDHGMEPKRRYWHETVGFNYRLTSLQAAIGLAQLEQLDEFLQRKQMLVDAYRRRLKGIDELILPTELPKAANICWMFTILLDDDHSDVSRDEVARQLGAANIETRPMFYPLHVMPPYRVYSAGRRFANSEWLSARGLSLPSGVNLSSGEVDYICDTLGRIINARRLMREVFGRAVKGSLSESFSA